MKKKLLLALFLLTVSGCGSDSVLLPDHNDRITELERRADLSDAIDAAQNRLIQLNAEALAAEVQNRIDGDADLQSLLAAEEQARIDGDIDNERALNRVVRRQRVKNRMILNKISQLARVQDRLKRKLNRLQGNVSGLSDDLDSLSSEVSSLQSDLSDLEIRVSANETDISDLESDLEETQEQLDEEGVRLFKCNSPSSSERLMRINGRFYGVMNRVTTRSIQVVTGSSSQTFTTPDMCEAWNGDLELPNSGGQCTPNSGPFKSTKIPGQTIVVPSYSTSSVTVVNSVKIALDLLVDGGYATTDGGSACHFTISNGSTSSSNLVEVQ